MRSFKNTRRSALRAIALASAVAFSGLTALAPATAAANTFPSKPITIIVPFSAGGTTDILARIIGQYLGTKFGESVVVENRDGAGGNIGTQTAARAKADGYTLLMGTVGTHAINASLYSRLNFDHIKDFQPLTRVALVPNLLVVNPDRPYRTVQEIIDYAKANPGGIAFASSGNGTSVHLSGELFKLMTGVDMLHVPYRGSAGAVTDLLGGQVDIMFDNMPSAIQHVRNNTLVPVAVTPAQRSAELPEIPTVAEAGVPGYEATSWFGLFAPAGTPDDVVKTLHAAIVEGLNDPEVIEKFSAQGAVITIDTPEEFADFIAAETEKWADVVKRSGATVN